MKKIVSQVIGYKGVQELEIEKGIIKSIRTLTSEEPKEREWISLGGVDIQINGALGLAFPDVEEKDIETIKNISYYLQEQGIDGYLPTIVTTSITRIQKALGVFKKVIEWQKTNFFSGAEIIGIHLEGPFLNCEKRGAHPLEYLLPLSQETVEKVIGDYIDIIKVITLAPEIDPKKEVIPYLKSLGIIVSLGHSQATDLEAKIAFQQGASMVTHAYNAMPVLHHRKPGLLGEAMLNQGVYCGVIADGEHVCPSMIEILLRVSNYEQGVFLVSDALAPLGLSDGTYPWDNREIEIQKGTARLSDGVLAGTTFPLLIGVNNLVNWGLCNSETAIALATESPRKALGIATLGIGSKASLLHWQQKQGQLTWERISDTL